MKVEDSEIRKIVAETVEQTLLRIGVDVDNPLEFQKDMQYLRAWRESITTVKKQSLLTAIAVITTGFLGLIWMAVKGQ